MGATATIAETMGEMTAGMIDRAHHRVRRRSVRPSALIVVAALQIMCGLFFVQDLLVSVLGLRSRPVSWTWHEAIEVFATIGLILGMTLGAILIRTLIRERQRDKTRLRAAAGEFYGVVQDQFEDWGLTPSERDVAMFMLKGLNNQEIATLRETSEGTTKAQTTAVFRKAGVSGRSQLFSLFIEELLTEQEKSESAGPTGS